MIEVILIIYFNPALTPLQYRDHFSLQNAEKYAILKVDF